MSQLEAHAAYLGFAALVFATLAVALWLLRHDEEE